MKMKAWKVESRDGYSYSTVVFAETREKARVEALATDCCEDMEYKDVQPRRFKEADVLYRGYREVDWYNPSDRRFLCLNGWHCEEPDVDECEACEAKDVCDGYEKEEMR